MQKYNEPNGVVCQFPHSFQEINAPLLKSKLTCNFCKLALLCMVICDIWIYYVIHDKKNMSCAYIHINEHKHLVWQGICKDITKLFNSLIWDEIKQSPKTKNLMIQMATSKEFLAIFVDNMNLLTFWHYKKFSY